jgi:hypothetical protein
MPSEENRVIKILKGLKHIHKNYVKRKFADKDTISILEYLIAQYESEAISFDMKRKYRK